MNDITPNVTTDRPSRPGTGGEAIIAENLGRSFGDVEALKDVSFAVPVGTVLGLLGPNGAGKTTAVRILTTLLRPDRGRALVLGRDVTKEAQAVRASIGLAGQYAAVDENLTARENLRLVGRLTQVPTKELAERTDELLEQFDLVAASDRLLRHFSGGMRRRLDLAAALVHRPPVLFLDEPTTGLDPTGRTELWKVIQNLVDRGTTVLLTTQYLEEADQLADHIVVIDHGTMIAEGTSSELKNRMGATVIEVGFNDGTVVAEAAAKLAPIGAVMIEGKLLRVNVTTGATAMLETVRILDAAKLTPSTMVLREPTLDDVFLALTGHAAEEKPDVEADAALPPTRSAGPEQVMTTTETTASPADPRFVLHAVRPKPVSDAITIAWRNLLNIRRNPQLLVFATIQPIVFVLMFRYVFGGSISVPGYDHYVDYLMPGIFIQTVVFGSLTTGVGLADDLQKGLIERFRSLPMARSGVLVGRTLADLVRNVFVVLLMAVVGFIVGWRIHTNPLALVAALFLVLGFAYSLSWLFAIVGMSAPNGETAQAVSFPILAPLVFASSAFVSVETMPQPLKAFATYQPVTIVVDTVRDLTHGGATASDLFWAVAWIVAIVAICAPIAVNKYRKTV